VAVQELNTNVTTATVAKQSNNFFILFLKLVNEFVTGVSTDFGG
jgi:hypothetical protein